MHTPEWFEKKDIDAFLARIGAFVVKPTTGGFGKSGMPDRVACIRGKFVAIEVKREGAHPTPLQLRRMDETRAAGGFAVAGTAAVVIKALVSHGYAA